MYADIYIYMYVCMYVCVFDICIYEQCVGVRLDIKIHKEVAMI